MSGGVVSLVAGDVVEVIEGDLLNLHGTVLSIEGDRVTILPRHEDLKVMASPILRKKSLPI